MKRIYITPSTYVDVLPVMECPLNASKPDGVGGSEDNPGSGGGYYDDARRRNSSYSRGASYVENNGGWSRGGLW